VGEDFDFFLRSLPIVLCLPDLLLYITGSLPWDMESTGVKDLIGYAKAIHHRHCHAHADPSFCLIGSRVFPCRLVIYWVVMLLFVSCPGCLRLPGRGGPPFQARKGTITSFTGPESEANSLEGNPEQSRPGLQMIGFGMTTPDSGEQRSRATRFLAVERTSEKEIIRAHDIRGPLSCLSRGRGRENFRDIKTLCGQGGHEIGCKANAGDHR